MQAHRRTKIVATLGPASRSPEVIAGLIEAGMNVARLNFSHGTHDEHLEVLHNVRTASEQLDSPVAVLLDLCGPKIRVGEAAGGSVELAPGRTVAIRRADGTPGTSSSLFVDAFEPAQVLRPGQRLLLSDGLVCLEVVELKERAAFCRVVDGGTVRSRSGLLLPDSDLDLAALTDKDRADAAWGAEHGVDFIALSFVRSAADISDLRSCLNGLRCAIPIIAKIETSKALARLDEIVSASDGIMVARGDLGIELALEKVPAAQKKIIALANAAARPVITATQMLRSMVDEARPTRAEVSDVCTAVRDGTDAVMLSEETTIGQHPIHAVQILSRILCEAEREFLDGSPLSKGVDGAGNVADATCYAAAGAAHKLNADALVICTQTGSTARLVGRYRPLQPLYAVTTDPSTQRRLALNWGVRPLLLQLPEGARTEDEIVAALSMLKKCCGLASGATVVITVGMRTKSTGSTCIMQIREIA